jgi:hypothetical protein
MKSVIKIIASCALVAAVLAGCSRVASEPKAGATEKPAITADAVYASFGSPVKPDGDTVPAAKLLANVPQYEGKSVRVSGTVSKVCERKGCWLEMTDSGKPLFVKFTCPVDGRLIPMDAVGKPAIVEGQLAIKEISEEDARHLAEEGGKTPDEVAKIVGPQKQITMKSPGAIVFGITK